MARMQIEGIRFPNEEALPEELRGGVPIDDLNRFFDTLSRESDRGLVLTIGSILDDQCRDWLASVFDKGNSDSRKAVMRSFGNFASRINGLHALGLISDGTFSDLHTIRVLRNAAAHGWAHFELDDAVSREHIDPLQSGIKQLDGPEGQTMLHARTKLVLSGAALLLSLSKKDGRAPTFARLEMLGPVDPENPTPAKE